MRDSSYYTCSTDEQNKDWENSGDFFQDTQEPKVV